MNKNQVAKKMRELVNIIRVRDHIVTLANSPRVNLISKDEERELRKFADSLDREVVETSLAIKESSLNQQAVNTASDHDKAHQQANAVKNHEAKTGGRVITKTVSAPKLSPTLPERDVNKEPANSLKKGVVHRRSNSEE